MVKPLDRQELGERLGCPPGIRLEHYLEIRVSQANQSAEIKAENERLREALERLAVLTPGRANATTAMDLHLTVKAIAETALANASDGRER
jgi:nitrogen-specific signal transduction histidine kinase